MILLPGFFQPRVVFLLLFDLVLQKGQAVAALLFVLGFGDVALLRQGVRFFLPGILLCLIFALFGLHGGKALLP